MVAFCLDQLDRLLWFEQEHGELTNAYSSSLSFLYHCFPDTPAEQIIVEHQIKNMAVEAVPYLDNEGAQFAVHVGDIMKGGRQADCSKWRYEMIENLYKEHCPVPSFMLPGDNDW